MKLKPSQIHIPSNYVLILPDPDFTNFHFAGHESTLQVGNKDAETLASHYSVRGKVYAVPDKLVFSLAQIKKNLVPEAPMLSNEEMFFYFKSNMVLNKGYKAGSVLFDVPMEVETGDVAYFNYQEHYSCYEQARWIETELGEMLLIKYDNLICCHPEANPSAVRMLNGYLLVEVISTTSVFGKRTYEKAGIVMNDSKDDTKRVTKKKSIGYITHFGSHVRNYLENSENNEGAHDFTGGELIVYNPKVAPPLQFNLHQSAFEGMELVKIHRKDIFCILPDEWKSELRELASSIHLN